MQKKIEAAVTEIYLKFCDGLERQGIVRLKGETPMLYYKRIKTLKPSWEKLVKEITETYIELVYVQPDAINNSEKVKRMAKKVKEFRLLLY